MGWSKVSPPTRAEVNPPVSKREKLTITKAIENKLNERKPKGRYLLDESTGINDVDDDILSMGLGEESKVTNEWGVDDVELKTCENNQQCNCGLMHHASEEIKLILDDVHSVPKLYINGEHKEHIVSIEYIFETSQADASGTNAYKVVFFDEDEDGNAHERTIAVKRFPSNEFEWITK